VPINCVVRVGRHWKLSLHRVPHVYPQVATKVLLPLQLHVNHVTLTASHVEAMPSQREGQLDEDADYQTAYQSARTGAVNGGRG